MSTIKFVLRTDQPNKDGACQVRLIYQIPENPRKYFHPKKSLYPINWDPKMQKAVYRSKLDFKKWLKDAKGLEIDLDLIPSVEEITDFNDDLNSYREDIKNIEKRYKLDGVPYSTEMVIEKLKANQKSTTKVELPKNHVFNFIDTYIKNNKETRVKGSLSVYRSLKSHLEAYEVEAKSKVTFESIDYSFFLSFQNFLISRSKIVAGKQVPMLNNTTIAKQLSTLKTFLNYARMHGWEVSNKYKEFKIKKENLEVIALTNDEFESIYNFDLTGNKRLGHVRDVFCFSCTTGLRYSDLSQLKREHIKNNEIRLTVTKTKQPLVIPLNPYSYAILEKYSALNKPLPVISNAKTNEYVKELCELVGINEPVQIVRYRGTVREEKTYPKYELITVHCGRRSFVCLSLEKGMSAEQVMSCTGHTSYNSFKRYMHVTEKLKKTVMHKAWGEIQQSKLKAV